LCPPDLFEQELLSVSFSLPLHNVRPSVKDCFFQTVTVCQTVENVKYYEKWTYNFFTLPGTFEIMLLIYLSHGGGRGLGWRWFDVVVGGRDVGGSLYYSRSTAWQNLVLLSSNDIRVNFVLPLVGALDCWNASYCCIVKHWHSVSSSFFTAHIFPCFFFVII